MLDITKIPEIVNHLKNTSNYYKESGGEIIIFCPYCDDASRPKASHGHMYISKTMPVFNCFRCSSSGNLVRLLIDTNFTDEDILKYLSSFIRYKNVKDYYRSKKKIAKLKQIQETVILKNLEFEKQYKNKFEIYRQYLIQRLGNIDFTKFLISPTFFNQKTSCTFTNSENEDIVLRLIEPYKDLRYHLNPDTSGKYFFQEIDFEKYSSIVLAEGPFDILNLYLYNIDFKNCFYIALNGKKYLNTIESLLIEHFLLKEIEINLIFDMDVIQKNQYKMYLYRSKLLTKQYNPNILIKGWKPLIKKDTGDFPAITEIS
ncbi:MAG: hypothetical protein WC188_03250 [Candidatus Caldatribacteriota bacterium]|nr:hypothetical protein [Patescibacteria group bacterium]